MVEKIVVDCKDFTSTGTVLKQFAELKNSHLIGNFDRHNGNWGFLINENLKKIEIAPIYDCASCLYLQLTDEKIINNNEELEARVYVFPTSALNKLF